MDNKRSFDRRDESVYDSPVYSRLFIVCARGVTENDFRNSFSQFGVIEEIRLPIDDNGRMKGVAFIKFSKTSEAALALEAMNNKSIPGSQRALRVNVAANRSEMANSDVEKYRRLFVTVAKNVTESQIEEEFKIFGHITSITLQRDHNTGESKGFAYISYAKFSQAAKAFEECDKKYRAIFAKPKIQNRPETVFESSIQTLSRNPPILDPKQYLVSKMSYAPGDGNNGVNFMCCPQFNHSQMERLFDLIPGFTRCDYLVDPIRNVGKGIAIYDNPTSAAYAVEKLNEFEYPPGMKIFVKLDSGYFDNYGPDYPHNNPRFYNRNDQIPRALNKLRRSIQSTSRSNAPDLVKLTEAIAEASKLVQKTTGMLNDNILPNSNDLNYCSVKLPPPKPLADIDSLVVKRCFLICKPSPPPLTVLRDIFCRFGDLINVYTLPNKTVGYARYASGKSADEAIRVLHGAEICGVRMKVLLADDEAPPRSKRERREATSTDKP